MTIRTVVGHRPGLLDLPQQQLGPHAKWRPTLTFDLIVHIPLRFSEVDRDVGT